MPRKKVRGPSRRVYILELDLNTREELLHGRPFFDGFKGDRDLFEAAWEDHGEALLAEFIREHPGRRPFGWWLLTHRRERPIVHPLRLAAEHEAAWRREHTYYGFLHSEIWASYDLERQEPLEWQEPETDYLHRHGLLSAEEEAMFYEPDDPAG